MIHTPRLLLRQFERQDQPIMTALLGDAEFMAYSPSGAMTTAQAELRFEQLLNAYTLHGTGKLAVIEKSTGQLIGYCGLEAFEYQGEPCVELGYRLARSARGNGYATEASQAVLESAKKAGYSRILALTEHDNVRSKHILARLGFVARETGIFDGMQVQFFEKRW